MAGAGTSAAAVVAGGGRGVMAGSSGSEDEEGSDGDRVPGSRDGLPRILESQPQLLLPRCRLSTAEGGVFGLHGGVFGQGSADTTIADFVGPPTLCATPTSTYDEDGRRARIIGIWPAARAQAKCAAAQQREHLEKPPWC